MIEFPPTENDFENVTYPLDTFTRKPRMDDLPLYSKYHHSMYSPTWRRAHLTKGLCTQLYANVSIPVTSWGESWLASS